MLNVTFLGVRAVPVADGGRHGGHTSCVILEVPNRDPVLLDLGSGLGRWAARFGPGDTVRAHALLSRAEEHRLAGLASLPLGAEVEVYGPAPAGRRLGDAVADALGPACVARTPSPACVARTPSPATVAPTPWLAERRGLRFHAVEDEELVVGDAKVVVRTAPDAGGANGYRVDWEGVSVAYIVDRWSAAGVDVVPQEALELADGVDLLIHDAGHGVDGAVLVAREAGARCLALFHHDHDDGHIDRLLAGARRTAERLGVDEVLAAAEGTTVSFER